MQSAQPDQTPNFFERLYGFFRYSIPYRIAGLYVKSRNKPIRFDTYYIEFPKSSLVEYGSYLFNDYEKQERRLIKKYLSADAVVLELGGCLGVVSNLINSLLSNPKAHVVLEPNPNMVDYIERNKSLNSAQYTILNKLISSEDTVPFKVYKSFLGSSIYDRPLNETPEIHHIKGITVPEIEFEFGFSFDTLIMDIEGDELNVLLMTDLSKINLLIIEFHFDVLGQEGHTQLVNYMTQAGFSLIETRGDVECWKRI